MKTYELLQIERPQPEIAVVHMRRESKLNALNAQLIADLTDAAHALRDDSLLKAVVVTGGLRAFSAGADLSTFTDIEGVTNVNEVRRAVAKGGRMIDAWQSIPAVTIAAVEGGAVGGGLGLCLACDWRVFARTAWGYVPEVKLGLNYGWGSLPRLTALAGPAKAKWISILCQRHDAAQLHQWNVVEQVAEPGQALQSALALAREVAVLPALAAQMIKKAVNVYSHALGAVASHSDMDDMLVCLTDSEGASARQRLASSVGSKKVSA